MKYIFVVFALVFSSMVVIPVYAETFSTDDSLDDTLEDRSNPSAGVCSVGSALLGGNYLAIRVDDNDGVSLDCAFVDITWDISSIPDDVTVTDAIFHFEQITSSNAINCDIYSIENQPSTGSVSQRFNDVQDGTPYVNDDPFCVGNGIKNIDLGNDAISDIQNAIDISREWFALGLKFDNIIMGSTAHTTYIASSDSSGYVKPTLQITYTSNVDTTPPIITLIGTALQTIELGDGYIELGATTDDGSSVTIDSSAYSDSIGSYSILYDSIDDVGNQAIQVTRTVNVVDTTPPIITLTGNNPQTIELGNGYTELGATTNDGSPIAIDSSSFTDSIGSYSILYNSVDSSGNNADTVTRIVNVNQTVVIETNPLIKMDEFFEKMGGLFFGLGIFTIFFLFIGFMASPKTVHIYTIIIMVFAGILNGMGVFVFPIWMWGVMIFMAIVLVFQRRRS